MQNVYNLIILLPQRKFLEKEVYEVKVKDEDGILSILPNHEPMLNLIKPSRITIVDQQTKETHYEIESGIISFSKNQLNIITTSIVECK